MSSFQQDPCWILLGAVFWFSKEVFAKAFELIRACGGPCFKNVDDVPVAMQRHFCEAPLPPSLQKKKTYEHMVLETRKFGGQARVQIGNNKTESKDL